MFNTMLFSRLPTNKRPHYKYKLPFEHAGSCLHGKCVPVYSKLVAPGDIINMKLFGNIRMSTPIAPLYSSIKWGFNAFYVPLRLVWEDTKHFFGEPEGDTVPVQTGEFKIPMSTINALAFNGDSETKVTVGSVSHYLNKPLYKGSAYDQEDTHVEEIAHASILKERAYWLIINEWYRHAMIEAPYIIDTGSNSLIGYLPDGTGIDFTTAPADCLKDFDYFTTCTPQPEFGEAVSLPLGTVAPVITSMSAHSVGDSPVALFNKTHDNFPGALYSYNDPDDPALPHWLSVSSLEDGDTNVVTPTEDYGVNMTNLVTDLSKATAASIDQLYLSMAAQAFYRNSNYGVRLFEFYQVHYGVNNPDLVLQRPEHIGYQDVYINVSQVLSTAGAAGDSSTLLGQPGANSSTDFEFSLFSHAVGEWGFIIIIANSYHEHYYTGGLLPEDCYEDMFDFFLPEFANIGDTPVMEKYLFQHNGIQNESSYKLDDVFGYQEAWAEMRYHPNQLSGLLDPYAEAGVNGSQNALKYWVLAEKFALPPRLNAGFIKENRSAIQNALVTGSGGPDYIFDIYFDERNDRLVPTRSIPGLPGRGAGLV